MIRWAQRSFAAGPVRFCRLFVVESAFHSSSGSSRKTAMTRIASVFGIRFKPAQGTRRSPLAPTVRFVLHLASCLAAGTGCFIHAAEADLILHHGKVATVDDRF